MLIAAKKRTKKRNHLYLIALVKNTPEVNFPEKK